MKSSIYPSGDAKSPVFPQTLHRMRKNPAALAKSKGPTTKRKKRDNIFSKSRDIREDRGERQVKNNRNPQTFPH